MSVLLGLVGAATLASTHETAVLPGAGAERFAYVTSDGGDTWGLTHPPFDCVAICNYGTTIFAMGSNHTTRDGLESYAARSTDGGKSWEQVVKLPNSVEGCTARSSTEVLAVSIFPSDLLWSSDAGASYTKVAHPKDPEESYIGVAADTAGGPMVAVGNVRSVTGADAAKAYVASPTDPTTWTLMDGPWKGASMLLAAASCDFGFVLSDDGGNVYVGDTKTWTAVELNVSHMAVTPRLTCTASGGVWSTQLSAPGFGGRSLCVSADKGASFDCSLSLAAELNPVALTAVGNDVYMTSAPKQDSTLYRAANGGRRWQKVTPARFA